MASRSRTRPSAAVPSIRNDRREIEENATTTSLFAKRRPLRNWHHRRALVGRSHDHQSHHNRTRRDQCHVHQFNEHQFDCDESSSSSLITSNPTSTNFAATNAARPISRRARSRSVRALALSTHRAEVFPQSQTAPTAKFSNSPVVCRRVGHRPFRKRWRLVSVGNDNRQPRALPSRHVASRSHRPIRNNDNRQHLQSQRQLPLPQNPTA